MVRDVGVCVLVGHKTGLARYGFEKSRLARTKDKPNKDQISRPKPKVKDQDQSQSNRPKQAHRPRTKAKD